MSHQYPFAGNPYAQADPSTINPAYSAYPPQSQSQPQPHNDSYPDPYSDDYQDRYQDPNQDTLRNERPAHNDPFSRENDDEKLPAVGTITSPYARDQSLDYSDRKGIWTRDDRRAFQKRGVAAKIFRTLFCLLIVALIFVISAFALVVTFVRPPNVGLANIEEPNTGDLKIASGGFTFNLTVNIAVSNPNSISATLKHVEAKLYDASYPTVQIGNGNINDVKINSNTNTTFGFPAQLKYSSSIDPNRQILTDIASKCGLSGGSASNLNFKLDLDITPNILGLSIPISVKGISFSFMCPNVLGSLGDGLGSILGGGSLGGASKRESVGNDLDFLGEQKEEYTGDGFIPRSSLGDDGQLVVHFARGLETTLHQLARGNQVDLIHDSL